METCAKEMKLLTDPTTDPFELIPVLLIHDQILQHFTGNEVKELFQVCVEWNEIVSASSASMKKLQLKIKDRILPEKFKGLLKSQRKYSNMKIRLESISDIEPRIRLLQQFSQSLVELDIDIESVGEHSKIIIHKIKFPKLKKLVMWNQAFKLLPSMEVNSLIDFNFGECDEEYAESISDFLKKQHRLKRLIVGVFWSDFERINFTNVPFALSHLSLNIWGGITPTAKLKIHSLLRNMSDSLETFETYEVSPECVKLIVNELPKLNTFINGLFQSDILNLKRNTSITTLGIKNHSLKSIPKSLILALENLQSLAVQYHKDSMQNFKEDFKWIVENSLKLEVLICYNRGQFEEIRTYYELLKTQDANINHNIDISTSMEE